MDRFAPDPGNSDRADLRRRLLRAILATALILLLVFPLHAQEAGAKRVALVIGNSAYQNVPALKNPRNDSADIAAALTEVGFEVILHADQTQGGMLDTLRAFRRQADGAEVALIYFAGHGIEIDRQNYLLPVDAVLETDSDVNFEAVKLETMVFATGGASRLSMVIVDACRDNPFAKAMKRSNSSRSIGQGLSAIEPTRNTLVAYAAKEGTTAADGAGRNSPYATALLASLHQPKLEVGLMMRQVRDDVLAATNGKQEPFVYGSLSAEQIFLADTRGLTPAQPVILDTDGVPGDVPDASAAEIVFWRSITDQSDPEELKTYLSIYPDGFFAELARSRIARADGAGGAVPPPQDQDKDQPVAVVAKEAPPEGEVEEPDRPLIRAELVELQERLSAAGHALGPADGIAGRRTEAAIRAFETSQDLPVSGEPTLTILTVLRDRVTEADLASWRASKTARAKPARTRTKTTTRKAPRAQAAAPRTQAAPTPQPKAAAASKRSAGTTQFCAANRQCATSQCRVGASTEFFRKTRSCRFCPVYAERCQ